MGHNYARDNAKARRKRRKKDEIRVLNKRLRPVLIEWQAVENMKSSIMDRLRKEGAF